MKKLSVIFIFLFIINLFSLDIEFFREDLNFEIKDEYFYVDGIYYFRNLEDKEIKQILFYPFPVDTLYGEVDSIQVVNIQNDSVDTITRRNERGAFFTLEVESDTIAEYRISYCQKLLGNKAEYILVTTQRWGKPFEQVNYKLVLPKELILDSLSYMPDSLQDLGDTYIFYWYKEDFMPDRNFEIHFSKKEE